MYDLRDIKPITIHPEMRRTFSMSSESATNSLHLLSHGQGLAE
jgi:hypothetical protein